MARVAVTSRRKYAYKKRIQAIKHVTYDIE